LVGWGKVLSNNNQRIGKGFKLPKHVGMIALGLGFS